MFLPRSSRASHRSAELFASLEELRRDRSVAPFILDVRGAGLMVGVEFASPTPASDPFRLQGAPANLASRIAKKCQENGLFILTTSVYQVGVFLLPFRTPTPRRYVSQVVRFIPPLNITKEELAKGMGVFHAAVKAVVKEG